MSKFIINKDGSIEQDKVFLCDKLLRKKCEIYPIDDLKTDMHFNSNDAVAFTLYKNNNGVFNPFWNKIDDIAIIFVEGKGYFEISAPKTNDGALYKQINGVSLGEAETSQTKITIEINTDDDIARTDYVPTVLCNPSNKEGSALHRIFKRMPQYKIGHVDDSIANIQRTFSFSSSTIMDALNQIAEEIECVFVFDNFSRTLNCYDLKDHCTNPTCIADNDYRNVVNGVCQHCNSSAYVVSGYGDNTGVFIDGTDDISETITVTGDKDSVKNCFKIEGADDTINDMIGSRLIGGNYIWKFSGYQLSQMSTALQNALSARNTLVKSYQEQFENLWDDYSACVEKINYYKSSMMPSDNTDETTAESVFNDIFGTNAKITYGCISNKYVTQTQLTNSLLRFAKLIAPATYTTELNYVSHTTTTDGTTNVINSITLNAHIYLTGEYKSDGTTLKDEYTSTNFTLPVKKGYNLYVSSSDNTVFTNDYYMYLRQQIEIAMADSDMADDEITFDPPVNATTTYDSKTTPLLYANYNNETNPLHLSSIHYTMYSINRLQSFYDAYEACSAVIAEKNADISSDDNNILKYVTVSGTKESIFDALLGKYHKYMECISARIKYLESKVATLENQRDTCKSQMQTIRDACDMQSYLEKYDNGSHGDDLWIELCSFRREDTYKNDNFIGDDVDDETLMLNVEDLIKQAEIEITKACEINYTVTATIANLLTMKEFEPFWDKIELGNYIRVRVDEDIYTLRLISISYDYNDLSHCYVEFADAVKNKNTSVNKVSEILKNASNMASSYDFVARQADKGSNANIAFQKMQNDSFDISNTMITTADNQDFIWNKYGILGRKFDYETNTYGDEQIKIINNLLCFTRDAWKHTCTAIGKICYWNPETNELEWDYGINGGVLIGNLIMTEKLIMMSENKSVIIDKNGITLDGGKITWKTKLPQDSVSGLSDYLEQLDGRIQTYVQESEPQWTDANANHNGDLWLKPSTGITYVYNSSNDSWSVTTDANLKELASKKAQIFTTTPTTPYYKGDLWVQGSSGDIKNCTTTRTSGSYVASEWVKSSKYTDDTKANSVANDLSSYENEINLFKDKVNTALTGSTTEIGSDYVISPKIGGGYLYISKNNCSVEIDPAQNYNSSNGNIIKVTSNGSDIFHIDRSGNGYFKGKIQANSGSFSGKIISSEGKIGNWTIVGSGMCSKENELSYFTTYGNGTDNPNDYQIDGINYQTTIRDGKIICGVVSSGHPELPDTSHGYVDMSAKGIYSKANGKDAINSYLFSVDTSNNTVSSNVNIQAPNISNTIIQWIIPITLNQHMDIENLATTVWDIPISNKGDINDVIIIPGGMSYGTITGFYYSDSESKVVVEARNLSGETHSLAGTMYFIGVKRI